MQPSWEQREDDQNAEDEARMRLLGEREGERQDSALFSLGPTGRPQLDIDGMFDGRPGLDDSARPAVYLWVIGAVVVVVIIAIGLLLKAVTHQ